MESVPPAIFILSHMGLGDQLVCLPIYRHFAQTHNVITAVKKHNVPSVRWMLHGLPVAILQVDGDEEAKRLAVIAEKRCSKVLRLGMFSNKPPFDSTHWDKEFYRQAGIPFENRWSDWKVERDLSREFQPRPHEFPYAFVHDDPERGFQIDYARMNLPSNLATIYVKKGGTDNLFDYCTAIENADELHLIDSCFAILADSLPNLKAKRKVIHLYARANALPPTYKQDWEILK